MQDSKRDTDVKNSLLDSVGEGKGGMIWENSIETCILSYVKQIASLGSMQDTGCSGLVHWDDPEGSGREGGGRGVQDGEHMYTMADSCQCMAKPIQYYKVISLQLKQCLLHPATGGISQVKRKKGWLKTTFAKLVFFIGFYICQGLFNFQVIFF